MKITSHALKFSPGDIVKIRLEMRQKESVSRAEIRASVRTWAEEAGVQLYAIEITAPRTAPSRGDRDRGRASDADLVRAYAKKMKAGKTCEAAGLKLMEDN